MRTSVRITVFDSCAISGLTETLSGLQNDFSVELGEKTDTLEKTQKDVIAATRDLAAIRQQLKVARESHNDHQAVQQKLSNLKRQLVQEQAYDWVQQQATGSESVDLADGSEFTLPDDAEVPYLRTVLDWQRYTAETVQKKRKEDDLQREASLKRFRKVMALVLKIAEDQVEMVSSSVPTLFPDLELNSRRPASRRICLGSWPQPSKTRLDQKKRARSRTW